MAGADQNHPPAGGSPNNDQNPNPVAQPVAVPAGQVPPDGMAQPPQQPPQQPQPGFGQGAFAFFNPAAAQGQNGPELDPDPAP